MPRRKKQSGADGAPGAPEWMVTFSDCMTLLLTFFVLLLSFSSFDEDILKQIMGSFNETFSYIGKKKAKNQDSMLTPNEFVSGVSLEDGSEAPTLQQGSSNGVKEEIESVDYANRKVFVNQSGKMFLGKGKELSPAGKNVLLDVANFLKEVPGRIVISENGMEDDNTAQFLGLPRAWEVLDYLAGKHGLDKKRFSISSSSTLSHGVLGTKLTHGIGDDSRRLEIVLLDRSIYN